jgi:uncharacterized protein
MEPYSRVQLSHPRPKKSDTLTEPNITPFKLFNSSSKSKQTTPSRFDQGLQLNYTVEFVWFETGKRLRPVHRQISDLTHTIITQGKDTEAIKL